MKKRIWLNPASSYDNGWMKCVVEQNKEDSSWDATLIIADCNRSASFNVSVYNKKDRQATLRKLRLMNDALSEMIEAIEQIGN